MEAKESALALTQFVKRPGYGRAGQARKFIANHFEVASFPDVQIVQYDVQVNNGTDVRALIKKVWNDPTVQEKLGQQGKPIIFDGNRLAWSRGPLSIGDELSLIVDLDHGRELRSGQKPNKHRLLIRKSAVVSMQVLREYINNQYTMDSDVLVAINFLDHLLRESPSKRLTAIKRTFFQEGRSYPLDGGVEAWKGIFQSVRPSLGKLTINVDVATTVFWSSGPLLDVIAKFVGTNPNGIVSRLTGPDSPRVMRELRKFKRLGFFIKYRGPEHEKKVYIVDGFSSSSADQDTFETKDKETVSVAQYFARTYNIRLRYPQLPLVETRKGAKFPIELCWVQPGQKYPYKISDRQTADMIKITATKPRERLQAIKENVELLGWNNDPVLKAYNMRISPNLIVSDGRVLDAPKIAYGDGSKQKFIIPREGRWNLIGQKLAAPMNLDSWGVLVFAPPRRVPEDIVQNFVRQFIRTHTGHGGSVGNKAPPILYADSSRDCGESLRAVYNAAGNAVHKRPQLLVCILLTKTVEPYSSIKNFCDTELGVLSQCVQSRHVEQAKPQYCANVDLKVNSKLGGTNVYLDRSSFPLFGKEPAIVLGADVSHPAPGSMRASFASMVGSVDLMATRYAGIVNTNGHRVETITRDNMILFVRQLLTQYRAKTGKVPVRIFYFRDGVSEGQYAAIIEKELAYIKEACQTLSAAYKPFITVTICTKRHHSRIFPADRNGGDRNGNVLPGTIIERDITHPSEYDFYLVSHIALQGTARPVHYHVIHDENKMPVDLFQQFVHNMCFTFARATTSVSLCPPVYYAHLAGQRGHAHEEDGGEDSLSMVSEKTGVSSGEDATVRKVRPLHATLAGEMWFI
ncbi:Piwi domain-containing protein [Limtongia smithiae]|uniref:Piwi domain-containing protein n=1 Tax=Limtongia smithiae TaxID=1125753 RepID=UPI0034CF6285